MIAGAAPALGPWDVAGLLAAVAGAALYAAGLWRIRRLPGGGRSAVPVPAAVACGLGWLALAAALGPPLAPLADLLFAVHMGQHELLMLVAPPLMVLGRPLQVVLRALPRRLRGAVARAVRARVVAPAWRLVTAPAAVLLLQTAVLWLWHLPGAFEAALRHDGLHALQHVSFFTAAALFWWALVHGRFGRLGYGVGVVAVFLTALQSGALGALVAVADAPLYPTHALHAAALGEDPLADQQLAGLLMWVPAGVALLVGGLALFAAALGQAARRAEASRTARLLAEEGRGPA